MNLREAAQQALEALDLLAKSEHPATNFTTKSGGRIYPHKVAVDAGAALRAALAEHDPAVQRDLAFQNMARIIRELKEEQQGGQE